LLGRMGFALKFLVVGLVLAAPLGVVAAAYVNAQRDQVAFTDEERVGVAAMAPLLRLVNSAAAARHTALTDGPTPVSPAALAAVAETQRRYGAELGTAAEWQRVSAPITTAGLAGPGPTAVTAYN